MKKILFIIAVATLATSCNNDDKWDATGTFEATEVVVSAQGSGEIKSFNVEEGQQVEAGTQLGYLDMTQLELQKAQFDANQDNLNATKSQLDANKDHMNSSKLQIDATQSATTSHVLDLEKQVASIKQQIANLQKEKARFSSMLKDNAASQKQVDDITYQILVLQKQLGATQEQINSSNQSFANQSKGYSAQKQGVDAQIKGVEAQKKGLDAQKQGIDAQKAIIDKQMQNAIKGSFDYADKIILQNDAFKRNEAEREYNERTTQLNTELAQKEGEERQKFQPKYEAEMKLASDKENYKNDTNLQEKSMGQALVTSTRNLYTAITPADNAKSVMDLLKDPNMGFAHGEQLIRDFYANRKGLPKEVVDQYVQDYKSKALTLAANRLAELTDQVNTNAAYDQSLNLINSGIQQGLINPEEGVELKRTLEDQKLDMIAETNPGVLINNDGTYNFNAAHRFAPDLTRKEIYKKIASGSRGSGSGGAGANLFLEQLSQMAADEWSDMVTNAGYGPELATEEYKKNRADIMKGKRKASGKAITDLIRFVNFGNSELNGVVVVNEDGTYTNPRTGVTTQTVGTGVKRILQKQTFTELNSKVNKAKAMIANLLETGAYKDIFTPEVFRAADSLSDGIISLPQSH